MKYHYSRDVGIGYGMLVKMDNAGNEVNSWIELVQFPYGNILPELQLLVAEIEGLNARQEQLEAQLAGCSVAALGGDGYGYCEKHSYGWSIAFEDVRQLRNRCDNAVDLVQDATTLFKDSEMDDAWDRVVCDWEALACALLKLVGKEPGMLSGMCKPMQDKVPDLMDSVVQLEVECAALKDENLRLQGELRKRGDVM